MQKLKKLFGGIDLSWKKLIIFAVCKVTKFLRINDADAADKG